MRESLTRLSELGVSLRDWCVTMNGITLALLALAYLADRLLARRLSPTWRMLLYVPVLLRVLIPLDVSWTTPFWEVPGPTTVRTYISDDPITRQLSMRAQGSVQATPPLWPGLVVTGYAMGVTALLAAWLRGAILIRYAVENSARSADDDVLISENLGPMVAGVIGSRVVVPRWLVGSPDLPMILAHERAHIARRDPALAFVLRLISTLAWPVAPVWFAASRIRALMEHACDERAIGQPSHRTTDAVMNYARVLIDVAEKTKPLGGTLAFGASLRSRVRALGMVRRWPAAVQVALALTLPVTLLACSAAKPGVQVAESPKTIAPFRPETETRVVNVRLVRGDISVPGGTRQASSPDIFVAESKRVMDPSSRDRDMQTDSWPRMLVAVGQQAEVRMEAAGQAVSIKVVVEPSTPDEVHAVLSYAEGSRFALANTTVKFRRGECCVIKLPSSMPDVPQRTLIVTIDRPSEESSFGC